MFFLINLVFFSLFLNAQQDFSYDRVDIHTAHCLNGSIKKSSSIYQKYETKAAITRLKEHIDDNKMISAADFSELDNHAQALKDLAESVEQSAFPRYKLYFYNPKKQVIIALLGLAAVAQYNYEFIDKSVLTAAGVTVGNALMNDNVQSIHSFCSSGLQNGNPYSFFSRLGLHAGWLFTKDISLTQHVAGVIGSGLSRIIAPVVNFSQQASTVAFMTGCGLATWSYKPAMRSMQQLFSREKLVQDKDSLKDIESNISGFCSDINSHKYQVYGLAKHGKNEPIGEFYKKNTRYALLVHEHEKEFDDIKSMVHHLSSKHAIAPKYIGLKKITNQ